MPLPVPFHRSKRDGVYSAASGNCHPHIVLRGGEDAPNYDLRAIQNAKSKLEAAGLESHAFSQTALTTIQEEIRARRLQYFPTSYNKLLTQILPFVA